jgi:hypothetical protein
MFTRMYFLMIFLAIVQLYSAAQAQYRDACQVWFAFAFLMWMVLMAITFYKAVVKVNDGELLLLRLLLLLLLGNVRASPTLWKHLLTVCSSLPLEHMHMQHLQALAAGSTNERICGSMTSGMQWGSSHAAPC